MDERYRLQPHPQPHAEGRRAGRTTRLAPELQGRARSRRRESRELPRPRGKTAQTRRGDRHPDRYLRDQTDRPETLPKRAPGRETKTESLSTIDRTEGAVTEGQAFSENPFMEHGSVWKTSHKRMRQMLSPDRGTGL